MMQVCFLFEKLQQQQQKTKKPKKRKQNKTNRKRSVQVKFKLFQHA